MPPKEVKEVTLKEAADLIGKHYVTTLKLARSGRLRAVRKGGQWYVAMEEIERFSKEGNYPVDDKEEPVSGETPSTATEQSGSVSS